MAGLWSLRGLTWRELAKRTCLRSWDDDVFGQSAKLAFYYFLALIPGLLLLLVLLHTSSGAGAELRNALLDTFQQIFPRQGSALLAETIGELNTRASLNAGAITAVISAAWAILNGTWAVIVGLNTAYGVKEERAWWKISMIAFGLTLSMAIMGLLALAAMLYGSRAGASISHHLGFHTLPLSWRIAQWLAILILLLLSFASLYRFGPNLKDRRWQWSTPGSVIAIVLWVASTLLLRISEDYFHSGRKIYAGLMPVVTVLLWLYLTGAAIFIGGEANSEIEKAAAEAGHPDVRKSGERRSGGPGANADTA